MFYIFHSLASQVRSGQVEDGKYKGRSKYNVKNKNRHEMRIEDMPKHR